jgi:glycosyltransferase involved in cell wall biosynthesis
MSDRISVVLATHNGERFLADQLESFERQTVQPHEVIVSDDASRDATLSIVEVFAARSQCPVYVHRNETPLGPAENFLSAALRAQGDVVAFSDQDDVWYPTKLERVLAEFARAPVRLVVHASEVVDADGRQTGQTFPTIARTHGAAALTTDPWLALPGMAMAFDARLVVLAARGPRPRSHLDPRERMLHDELIYTLARATGTIVFIADRLASYRSHDANVLGAPSPEESSWRQAPRVGSGYYRARAEQAADIAALFDHLAVDAESESRERDAFVRASQSYRRLAEVTERRLQAYEPSLSRLARFRSVLSLLRSGGYRPRRRGGAGRRALLKDVALALIGAGDDERRS